MVGSLVRRRKMNKKECISILRRHNEWRRGGEDDMLEPRIIGEAIDFAISELIASSMTSAVKSCETCLKNEDCPHVRSMCIENGYNCWCPV